MKKRSPDYINEHGLIKDIRDIIAQARSLARKHVNSLLVISNYLIGMRIVEEEQQGQERAAYGQETLKQLSAHLSHEFGRGYSHRNLELMRKFYLTYQPISQTLSAKSDTTQLSLAHMSRTLSEKLPLSWSHYLFLMGISNLEERRFYELEAANEDLHKLSLKIG